MPVVKQAIATKIRAFIEKQKNNEDTDQAVQEFSDELAGIIEEAILSANIIADPGTVVVVGGPTTQTNPAPLIFRII